MSAVASSTLLAAMLEAAERVGPVTARKLFDQYEQAEDLLDRLGTRHGLGESLEPIRQKIAEVDRTRVADAVAHAASKGVTTVGLWDAAYPSRLAELPDPPILLRLKGKLGTQIFDRLCIGIVGTRSATPYGLRHTRRFSIELARTGAVVVSGFAAGIDGEAHRAVLDSGGLTAAVFGCGPDVIYPAEHRKLYEPMLEKGLVISEYPLRTQPEAGLFPRRNRIVAGLCHGLLVVEGAAKSGALITAQLAIDAGRDVFAIPGPIESSKSAAPHQLLKQSVAKFVTEPEDILIEYRSGQLDLSLDHSASPQPSLSATAPERRYEALLARVPQHLRGLAGAFQPAVQVHVDELAAQTQTPVSTLLANLLELELAGIVELLPGNRYVLKL